MEKFNLTTGSQFAYQKIEPSEEFSAPLHELRYSSSFANDIINGFIDNITGINTSSVFGLTVREALLDKSVIFSEETGDDKSIYLLDSEFKLLELWCGWQMGLANKDPKELFFFERGHYVATEILEGYILRYNHLITTGNIVVVNLGELRSYIIRHTGGIMQSKLKETTAFIDVKLRHPYPLIPENTPVITLNEEAEAYIFCEYQGVVTKPWCTCLLAHMVDGVLVYREMRRSEFKPITQEVMGNTNALGQSVFARRFPELR